MRSLWTASALLLLLGSPLWATQQVVETIDRSFTVDGTPEIYVRNVDGRIEVTAHSGSDVEVRAIKEVTRASSDSEAKREAEKVKVRIEQVGDRIEIEAEYPKTLFSFNGPKAVVHFEIRTPRRTNLDAKSVDGQLKVTGLEGDLRLKTVDGDLHADGCSGSIVAEGVDGDLLLRELDGNVDARTVDGDLELDGRLSVVQAKSTDGDIAIQVQANSAMTEDWSIRSTDGSIRLELPDGFGADLDVEVSDGDIETDHPLALEGKLSSHQLQGKLYGGGHLLRIRTKDGSVELTR